MLDVGQQAPDFTLPDQDGHDVRLSSLRGRPVLVYFYPADDTPGCTAQACGVRDHWAEFQRLGVVVLGVSPDAVADHARFRAKYDLPHVLLADPDRRVLEPWGAWGEKVLYGQRSVGVIRSAVLIDAEGRVAKVWKRVGAQAFPQQALAAAADLGPVTG